jgi:hypothetical protein
MESRAFGATPLDRLVRPRSIRIWNGPLHIEPFEAEPLNMAQYNLQERTTVENSCFERQNDATCDL